ncbi:MAG TPA: hypothetical protein VGO66_00540 [Solirubrobacterales bacterium]|nr:hypothetical protein [Solirubrobacterales bacterium]
MSTIAVFLILGGATAFAASNLGKNTVGSKQLKKNSVSGAKIKDNAVTGTKVQDGSLLSGDFAAGQIPKGATGATGPAGKTGAAGTAVAFARIDAAGALVGGLAQNKGVEALDIQHDVGAATAETTGAGVYCLGGLDFTPTSAMVALDNTDSLPTVPELTGGSLNFISSVAVFKGEDFSRCNATHGQVRVAIEQVSNAAAPTLANHGFLIWFEG